MIIDETFIWKQVQDLTITSWIVIEEDQLAKINLGTKENVATLVLGSQLRQGLARLRAKREA
jgi:hypothetical protein